MKAKAPTSRYLSALMLQRKCACGSKTRTSEKCDECRKSDFQRKANSASAHDEMPPVVHDVLRSPGQPLDHQTRTFMELRFAHDFSEVRVHDDGRAKESAKKVNARAYAVGNAIVFNSEEHYGSASKGNQLLSHELTRVVQQRNCSRQVPASLKVDPDNSKSEREAQGAERGVYMPSELSRSERVLARTPNDRPPREATESDIVPCTTCAEDECQLRKEEKKTQCQSGTDCGSMNYESEILLAMAKRFACYIARWKLMKVCFGGGDAKHEQHLEEELNGFFKCKEQLKIVSRARFKRYGLKGNQFNQMLLGALAAMVIAAALTLPLPAVAVAALATLILFLKSANTSANDNRIATELSELQS